MVEEEEEAEAEAEAEAGVEAEAEAGVTVVVVAVVVAIVVAQDILEVGAGAEVRAEAVQEVEAVLMDITGDMSTLLEEDIAWMVREIVLQY